MNQKAGLTSNRLIAALIAVSLLCLTASGYLYLNRIEAPKPVPATDLATVTATPRQEPTPEIARVEQPKPLTETPPEIHPLAKRSHHPTTAQPRPEHVAKAPIPEQNTEIRRPAQSVEKTQSHDETQPVSINKTDVPRLIQRPPKAAEKKEMATVPSSLLETVETPDTSEAGPDNRLQLGFVYGMTTLHSQDHASGTEADLLSSYDVTLRAHWAQTWTPEFRSFTEFSVREIAFEPSDNSQKKLREQNHNLAKMALGGDQQVTPKLTLGASASYGQELFVAGVSSDEIEAVAVPVAKLTGRARYRVLKKGRTEISVTGKVSALGPGSKQSLSVQSGSEVEAGICLNQGYHEDSNLMLTFGFKQRMQNTSVTNQTETMAFADLTFEIPFLEDRKKRP